MKRQNRNDRDPRRGRAGFSLLEIMIAVTIVALMASVVAINLFPQLFQAKRDKAIVDIGVIKEAINLYRTKSSNNKLPEPSEFPQCLVETQKDGTPPLIDPDKLTDGKLLDPWGHEYVYTKNSGWDFEVVSYGEDGQPGGDGPAADISSKGKSEQK